MDGVALAVAQHLHLDVARTLDIGFGIDAAVAEIAFRLAGARCAQPRCNSARRPHDAHALAAAAGRGLDEQREADVFRPRGSEGAARRRSA